ncbi:MAG TPA: ATP-binding protein [Polyangiales bacterium]
MTPEERLAALQRENAALRAQLAALQGQDQPAYDSQQGAVDRLLADRRMLASLPDVVTVLDRNMRMLYINHGVTVLHLASAIGDNALDYLYPEQRAPFTNVFERAWHSGEADQVEVHTLSDHFYETRFMPIVERGAVQLMLCTSRNVTERKRAEQALRESEARLRHAIEASGMGSWTWDRHANAVSWDDALCRIWGIEPGASPKSFEQYQEMLHPVDRDRVSLSIERALQDGVYQEFEHRIVRPGGEVRHVMAKGVVIRDEHGAIVGLRGGVFDVTARHRLEEQLKQVQKMEAVGQLTAGIAHNFNNLLAVILPSIELCRRGTAANINSHLDDLEHAAKRASEMVRQLMLFARSGGDAHKTAVDLAACARRTLDICATSFDRRIKLSLEAEPGVSAALGNAGQLEQVLLNICLNARDALQESQPAEPSIRLRVEQGGQGPRSVRVRITDNGPGMDEATRARAFEPFFTTKPVGVGTGLGLASAYAIIVDHRGSISCTSRPGFGTSFEIELPVASTPELAASKVASSVFVDASTGNETLLIVDDEPLVRRALRALLERAGYRVLEAGHGGDALQLLALGEPRVDLAIVDRSMPEMSGEELLVQLAARGLDVPVLLLSGNPGATLPSARVHAVLAKPVDSQTLLDAVREAIDVRKRDDAR